MVPALLSPVSRSGIDVIAGGAILLQARCALLARWTRRQTYMCAKNNPDFAMKSGFGVSFRVPKVTSVAYDRSFILSSGTGPMPLFSAMSRWAVAIAGLYDVLAATEPLSCCQPKLEEDEPLHGPWYIRVGYELSAVPIPPLEAKLHAL